MVGSHLDTQPTGGRYVRLRVSLVVRATLNKEQDGILGVCAGVEMLRVLHEEKIETRFPVGVINWTK